MSVEYILLGGLVALGMILGLSLLSNAKQGGFATVACRLLGSATGSSIAGCSAGGATANAQTQRPLPMGAQPEIQRVPVPIPRDTRSKDAIRDGLGLHLRPGPDRSGTPPDGLVQTASGDVQYCFAGRCLPTTQDELGNFYLGAYVDAAGELVLPAPNAPALGSGAAVQRPDSGTVWMVQDSRPTAANGDWSVLEVAQTLNWIFVESTLGDKGNYLAQVREMVAETGANAAAEAFLARMEYDPTTGELEFDPGFRDLARTHGLLLGADLTSLFIDDGKAPDPFIPFHERSGSAGVLEVLRIMFPEGDLATTFVEINAPRIKSSGFRGSHGIGAVVNRSWVSDSSLDRVVVNELFHQTLAELNGWNDQQGYHFRPRFHVGLPREAIDPWSLPTVDDEVLWYPWDEALYTRVTQNRMVNEFGSNTASMLLSPRATMVDVLGNIIDRSFDDGHAPTRNYLYSEKFMVDVLRHRWQQDGSFDSAFDELQTNVQEALSRGGEAVALVEDFVAALPEEDVVALQVAHLDQWNDFLPEVIRLRGAAVPELRKPNWLERKFPVWIGGARSRPNPFRELEN